MKIQFVSLLCVLAAFTLFTAMGCRDTTVQELPPSEDPTTQVEAPPVGAEANPEAVIEGELAKLTPEQQETARNQDICPVSDHRLGSMGAPISVDVDGKSVWICCEGCRDPLLKDSEKFLAKLKKE